MASGVYITAAEGLSGKSTVALGIVDALAARVSTVGVFRPVARSLGEPDYVLELLLSHKAVSLNYEQCVGVGYDDVHRDPDQALSDIVRKYRELEKICDTVVILGSDYTDVGNPTEFEFNAKVAANLGVPVVLVVTGRDPAEQAHRGLAAAPSRAPKDIARVTQSALGELRDHHANPVAVVVNRAEASDTAQIIKAVSNVAPGLQVAAVPEDRFLVAPTVQSVIDAVSGELFQGDPEALGREALGVMVAAMSLETVLSRLQEGYLVLVPGDRFEILTAVVLAHQSDNFPSLAGVVLYGGFDLPQSVRDLLAGLDTSLPIITTPYDTYETVLHVTASQGRMAADSQRKYDTALALFRNSVDTDALLASLDVASSDVVTPLMFEYDLLERARSNRKHIVLPEGHDDRIIRAAASLLSRNVVELTLLGDEALIRQRAGELGLSLEGAGILSPHDPELVERFATEYQRLRQHKGVTVEQARDIVTDVSYFGTMMVHLGLADGMVSGAANTTAHTITPSFQIIKTQPGVSVVSSVFFMCLADRVLVYGDCAIVPEPTAEQLADIAVSAAHTAQQFGIEPRVAMLSYSTGTSGSGDEVEKVRAATALVRASHPELPLEGPIQYDAAAEPEVAQKKMPESEVAGRATVYIFPDLNTGNNTYKAVQRSAGAVAIGPVLQGLNKPVNDLSRGATVRDIVNTVAITAIQAAGEG
jgi:phosphate acetyltransferase